MTRQPVLLGPELELPIAKLIPGRKFRELNPAKVAEIQASLPEQGLLYAIIVKPQNAEGFYKISDGDHRYFACKQAGWTTIRSRIGSADDVMAGMQGVVGNLLRNEVMDYTLLGDWFREALHAPGWDLVRVARTAGKTTDFIERQMKRAEAIDPKLHGQFATVIPRTLTDDFAKIPREEQAVVFEKIKKRKEKAYLSTQQIRAIITHYPNYTKAHVDQQKMQTCQRCGGILDQASIDAGKTATSMGKDGLEYSHRDPGDCHFTDTLVVTYTAKTPHQTIHELLVSTKDNLQDLDDVHVDLYGRRRQPPS